MSIQSATMTITYLPIALVMMDVSYHRHVNLFAYCLDTILK